ncbi:MAG: hypothetical protein ACYCZ0_00545 [Minisyncoccota bacterium]
MITSTSTLALAAQLQTAINAYSTATAAYQIATVVAVAMAFVLGLIIFMMKKEVRLFLNRKRPIKIFYAKGGSLDMKMETKTLRESGFFKIPEDPTDDFRDCHRLTNHGLIIIGYAPGMEGLKDILDAVKAKRIPLIVYTKERLSPEDQALLETYPWYSLCNVPLRVVSDAFTILSTFPIPKYDKK